MFDSDDDDIQYWGTYPSTRNRNDSNQIVPLVPNSVPGSSMLSSSYASASGDARVASQRVPSVLSAGANTPSILKSVAKPEQPLNSIVSSSLSPPSVACIGFVCRSELCAGSNHAYCRQATQHNGVRTSSTSSTSSKVPTAIIGSPVPSVTSQQRTEARSALPITSASVNKQTVLDSGLHSSHQPSSSSSHALLYAPTESQVPQGDDQSRSVRVPSLPITPAREAIHPQVVGDIQELPNDSTDDQSLHHVASVLTNCSSSDSRWKENASSQESRPIVLSCDMSSIFTHFCDYLGDRERGRSLQVGSTDSTVIYEGPLATAADLKLAALTETFKQSQHDLFNEWINARLEEEPRRNQSTVASLSLVRHSSSGQPPREPRNTEDPNKHIKWWTGRDPEPRCPSCDEYEGGSAFARTTHYLKWHYDIYYKDSSEVDDELFLSVRLGRKRRPGLGDLRACLICHFGSLHDGREGLLAHFEKNELNDIKPVSATRNKRRKKESTVTPNTIASKRESNMAKAVREKEGTWLTDDDARKFREWMDYWESTEGKKNRRPPKANVHLKVISSQCKKRAINRTSKHAASNAMKSERARAVREKLTRCYADYGMALTDGVWLRDEDAAKFEEWMDYWESEEGKAAGGPPKQGNS
ncbi:hypothetical protein PRIPAC_95805 [Pristionchus pacificus]|uniref:Uncharacterized protein n=1 Tax=Pristionchus pacificus TaxID=54126 RepID=A0A2A6BBZ9_PRIPA|nr:hypothetical protein PRIPAC_95805 [Pristionchus pacificus]|eukprot:PDM63371.1 hypothetical protein PRIPAC_53728 [Pristionchus pacificus]